MIEAKKDLIREECRLTIMEGMMNIATALRIARETCDEDLKEWFAEIGEKTITEVDKMTLDEFNEFISLERSKV